MKDILLAEVAGGRAVLFSSHQLDLVSDISRKVVIVDAGRVVLEGEVREIRERAEFRYAEIAFAGATVWRPDGHVDVVSADARSVRVRVRAGTDPSALLLDAERAGKVIEFSFVPPDLSEVFLAAVGREAFVHDQDREPVR